MQEPVELQVRKYGNEWGIMLQQSVERKQFLSEYFGIWLTPNVACVCSTVSFLLNVIILSFTENSRTF
jgi:ABC-type dipeptide/oligopeptide/nickel transport system permease subunit